MFSHVLSSKQKMLCQLKPKEIKQTPVRLKLAHQTLSSFSRVKCRIDTIKRIKGDSKIIAILLCCLTILSGGSPDSWYKQFIGKKGLWFTKQLKDLIEQ